MKDCGVKANRERDYFVSRAQADKVLAACPSTQWRLVFGLSRFGGLRCPSEHSALRWADIDFTAGRMTVRSPKTEHHEGKDCRVVPIFPELRPYLEAAHAERGDGEYVVNLPGVVRCRGCDKASNLGTQMARIVKAAGLTPWPKLFHNLRASRQTELAGNFPEHVACEWIGNSKAVAREHYLRVTEADYAKALIETDAAQLAAPEDAQTVSTIMRQGCTPSLAGSGLLLQIVEKALKHGQSEQLAAIISKSLQSQLMPRVGLELDVRSPDATSELEKFPGSRAAESGAVKTQYHPEAAAGEIARIHPELAKIIEAWPMLPGNAKEAIVAIVQGAKALGPQA